MPCGPDSDTICVDLADGGMADGGTADAGVVDGGPSDGGVEPPDPDGEAGCSCRASRPSDGPGALVWLAVGALGWVRRRRAARRRR